MPLISATSEAMVGCKIKILLGKLMRAWLKKKNGEGESTGHSYLAWNPSI